MLNSLHVTRNNVKWTGSPSQLHDYFEQHFIKARQLQANNVEELQDSIFFGWFFDCYCGASGVNYDDKKKSIQCNVCQLWMHCACAGVPEEDQEIRSFFRGHKNVWVCPSCVKGTFRHKADVWNVPKDSDKKRNFVSFNEKEIELQDKNRKKKILS